MRIQAQKKIIYTLVLNEKEAKWLKELMQNPLYGEISENENPKNKEMREIFWNGLNKIGANIS